MYCKKCGKSLPDDARFCDRCNMSVRKKSDKQELIDELKEERLARRQAKVVEERLKKIKKVKHRRYKNVVAIVVLILLTSVLSGVIGWVMINPNSGDIDEGILRTEETAEPTKAPKIVTGGTQVPAAATPSPKPDGTPSPATLNSDGYYITEVSGMQFAYPRDFKDYESEGEALLSLYDVTGDAVLVAGKTITKLPPKDLMENYYADMGGTVLESRAGEKEYEISLMTGTEIYHRKSCVSDGVEIYYEISYPSASQYRQQYIDDIEYMDTFFTNK